MPHPGTHQFHSLLHKVEPSAAQNEKRSVRDEALFQLQVGVEPQKAKAEAGPEPDGLKAPEIEQDREQDIEADEESPQAVVGDARPREEDPLVLRQLLLKVCREGGREPRGQAGLDRDDIEKDHPLADELRYEWPPRHDFESHVQGAFCEGR